MQLAKNLCVFHTFKRRTQKSHQRPIIITVLKGYKCKNKVCDPPSVSSVRFKIEISPTEQHYMSQKLRKERFLLFSFVVLPSSFLTLSIINILKCNCCIYCKAQLQPCSNPAEWKFQLKNISSIQADKQQGFAM